MISFLRSHVGRVRNKAYVTLHYIFIYFFKPCAHASTSEFNLRCKRSKYYQDKYNIRLLLSNSHWAKSSAKSLQGCARCLVSLSAQVSHIQYQRIAGSIVREPKQQVRRKKKTPPWRNDSRYWREKEVSKVSAFQKGNNEGHGVWCCYVGPENELVDDGINQASVALNANAHMFSCSFAFLITVSTWNLTIHCCRRSEVPLSAARPVISADWSNRLLCEMWRVCFLFLSLFFAAALVFLLWWVNTRSKWSLSSDITCQSRQEKCSLKVTLLWCPYTSCHYIFHFLWAKTYNLSFDRRSKHL